MIRSGPLSALRVLEVDGLGPGPHCAMLLADLGADVVTVIRATPPRLPVTRPEAITPSLRSKTAVVLNLKDADDVARFLDLSTRADVVIDPLRPGVLERLGVGPDDCLARNPALVFARVTGWGQDGPLAQDGGHDLTYLAITGVLHAIGRAGQGPSFPPALVADFGGGSLYLALGILVALTESRRTGAGQVVDVAMVDAVASLATMYYPMSRTGMWRPERGTNYLDSGAPYYDVYECAGGEYVAVAAIEEKFYDNFLTALGLAGADLPDRIDPANWDSLRTLFQERLRARTRDEWEAHFADKDACVAPVLSFAEAQDHPHLRARHTFVDVDGVEQVAPMPRFGSHVDPPVPRERLESIEPVLDRWRPRQRS